MSLESMVSRRPWSLDALLAAATTIAFLAAAATSSEEATREPGIVSLGFAIALGGALFFRRRWPLGAFVYSIVLITVYMALDYPAVGLAFPLAASLYTAARYGKGLAAAWVAGIALATGVVFRIVVEPENPFNVVVNMAQEGVGLAAALFLGETVRSRRALARETKARLALVESEQKLEAEQRVAQERIEIARDLHDLIAHTVTVIGVQANLAADAFNVDPEESREALGSIQTASTEAMAELRSAVAVLRYGENVPLLPTPGLDELEDLAERARAGGIDVNLHAVGVGELPGMVAVAVYRIVQESLTNVLRHSGASSVEIVVERRDDLLSISVVDNGRGAIGNASPGYGIMGMTERVNSLGGKIRTGGRADGGFRVEAEIPLRPAG